MVTTAEEALRSFNLFLIRPCMVPANYNRTDVPIQAIYKACIVCLPPRTRLNDINSKWTSGRASILLIPSAVDHEYTRLSVARVFESRSKGIHVLKQAIPDVVCGNQQ